MERRYFDFEARVSDIAGTQSEWNDGTGTNPPPLRAYYYRRLRVSRLAASVVGMPLGQREPSYTAGRATNGYVSLEADIAHATLTHQQDTGNWPAEIKVAFYRPTDIEGGVPVRPPFAYTSDYRIRPGAPEQSVEAAISRTGAEWVPTAAVLSSATGTNLFQAVRDAGDYPLRWGEFLAEGGRPESYTYGGLPNGTWVMRADMRDVHGSRATTTLSQNVTIALPEVRSVLAAPRIYDINDRVATTGTPPSEVTSGLAPGAYIGIGFTEVSDTTKGLVSFVEVERREVTAAGTFIPGTPRSSPLPGSS